jgi:hypothetical protein
MLKKALITIGKVGCLTRAYMAAALAIAAVYARDGGMTFADLSAAVSSPILSRLLVVFFVVCGGMTVATWPTSRRKPLLRFLLIGGILGSAIASLAAGTSVGSFWIGVAVSSTFSVVFRVYQLHPDIFRLVRR